MVRIAPSLIVVSSTIVSVEYAAAAKKYSPSCGTRMVIDKARSREALVREGASLRSVDATSVGE